MLEEKVCDTTVKEFLHIEHISKNFGGVHALIDAGLSCRRGETHVLIGENGAGKSTLVKILCGAVQRDEGSVSIDGESLEINNTKDAADHKIAAVFQELSLIQDLSIAENIFLGHEVTNKLGQISFRAMYDQAQQFFSELDIDLNPRVLVRDLNLCEMQVVEIAKAFYKKPEILILDEATSALGENEVKWLFKKVKEFTHKENNTVIFISHRMDELHQVADRATIFRNAKYILSFDWGELSDDEIVAHISGKAKNHQNFERNVPHSNEIVLEVENASCAPVLHNISFKLRKGEILGIAGLSGHGQVELLHTLFGDGKFDTGTIRIGGNEVKVRNEREALKQGIALVPEDRKNEGLILSRSISENLSMMGLEKIQKMGVILKTREQKYISDSVSNLSIKTHNTKLDVSSLSGGNQQKVVIAKALMVDSKVLMLSDPTRGIDIGTKNEIYKLMTELADSGMSILFHTTELTELLLLCSKVLVFYEGRITAQLVDDQITEKNIIASALGFRGDN